MTQRDYIVFLAVLMFIYFFRCFSRNMFLKKRAINMKRLAGSMNLEYKKTLINDEDNFMNYISGKYNNHRIIIYDEYAGGYKGIVKTTDIIIDDKLINEKTELFSLEGLFWFISPKLIKRKIDKYIINSPTVG